MKRILLSTLLIITAMCAAFAQEVSFVASAPKSVVVNKRFNISYEINTKADSQPTISEVDGLRILTGPHMSTFMSSQNINGHRTSKQTITYTYTVVADVEGDMKIPGASVIVDGKKYTSNPLAIKVLPEGQASPGQQQGNGQSNQAQRQAGSSSTNISNDDLFIVASVNKNKVFNQEALLLTYKVYTSVNLVNLDNPVPDLKGFNIQEIELPQQRQFELEHYNGRNYNMLVWRKFVLFPQETGRIEIPSMEYEAVVAVQTRQSMDPFEMMFNGGYSYVEVNKRIKSNKVVIDVESLPTGKPAGFSGGVGHFSLKSDISTTNLKSNEEFTLKVTVKGNGNMKLMGNPVIEFPSEFDVYDPIITNNYRLTEKGFAGEKIYEYVVTPLAKGTYTLPAAKFVYFDTSTGGYKTVEGQEYTIEVEKGATLPANTGGSYVVKGDGQRIGEDIHHIKPGNDSNSHFFASRMYYLLYAISFAVFAVAVFFLWLHRSQNSDTVLVKTKKANTVAVRRLKKAKSLLAGGNTNEFYDEVLKATWGYMSDKLNIPLSQLSKDNIASELARRGCSDAVVAELMELLNEGEFARYAPGDAGATMENVYRMALGVINRMENSIKK